METDSLKIQAHLLGRENKGAVLVLHGFIDSATAHLLKEKLLVLGKDINLFILDFGGVKFIASAGWGVILGRIKENRDKGGDIFFANMASDVLSIYKLLDLNKVTKYFTSVDEAVKHAGISMPVIGGEKVPQSAAMKPRNIPQKKPTLEEAVRSIVMNSPLSNASQLKKILQGAPYHFSSLSVWKVYSTLRRLRLNTREQRLYFAWQQERRKRKE
ncbi:MAG TPA: STAS domain-containing protein [bacterium]